MEKFNLEMAKALYLKFSVIYGEKFFKNYRTEQIIEIWWDEWVSGMKGIDPKSIKAALNECKLTLEWPPSIAEFRHICEKVSGVLSSEKIMKLAINRDFNDPIVKYVFEKIGSWNFSHDGEKELLKKINEARKDYLSNVRQGLPNSPTTIGQPYPRLRVI